MQCLRSKTHDFLCHWTDLHVHMIFSILNIVHTLSLHSFLFGGLWLKTRSSNCFFTIKSRILSKEVKFPSGILSGTMPSVYNGRSKVTSIPKICFISIWIFLDFFYIWIKSPTTPQFLQHISEVLLYFDVIDGVVDGSHFDLPIKLPCGPTSYLMSCFECFFLLFICYYKMHFQFPFFLWHPNCCC